MFRRKFSWISGFLITLLRAQTVHIFVLSFVLPCYRYGWLPEWSAEAAVHAVALLARREDDLGLVLVHVVLVPRVAPRYDLRRAHPLTDSDLKERIPFSTISLLRLCGPYS